MLIILLNIIAIVIVIKIIIISISLNLLYSIINMLKNELKTDSIAFCMMWFYCWANKITLDHLYNYK